MMGWIPLPLKWALFYRALAYGELLLGTILEPKPRRGLYYFDEEQKRLFEESRDAYQATMIWLYLVGACWCTYI
jgi:hypothetical protein